MFRVQGFEDMMLRGVPSSFGDVKTPYVCHLKYIISCKKTHKYDLIIEIPSKCIFSTIGYQPGGTVINCYRETLQIRTNSNVKQYIYV